MWVLEVEPRFSAAMLLVISPAPAPLASPWLGTTGIVEMWMSVRATPTSARRNSAV